MKIAINGFGRIGRQAFKIALEKKDVQVVAINDLTDTETLATLLKYDTVYGVYGKKVSFDKDHLVVGGKIFLVLAEKELGKLPWKKLGVDVVLECTGRYTHAPKPHGGLVRGKQKMEDAPAYAHIKAGAKRVIVSAPTTNETKTYLMGVNTKNYKGEKVVSNASCTTNCDAPVASVMLSNFGVKKAMLTTVHAYTVEQNLVDGPTPALHRDLRRARAAAQNIVPTPTGAAISTTEVIPELKGKFDGIAMRVPVICGSLTDFTFLLKKKVTVAQVNKAFTDAEKHPLYKGIISTTTDPIVSHDIIGNPASAIVDLSLTKVVDGDLVKVIAWYDNEFGYANRLVEMAMRIA